MCYTALAASGTAAKKNIFLLNKYVTLCNGRLISRRVCKSRIPSTHRLRLHEKKSVQQKLEFIANNANDNAYIRLGKITKKKQFFVCSENRELINCVDLLKENYVKAYSVGAYTP